MSSLSAGSMKSATTPHGTIFGSWVIVRPLCGESPVRGPRVCARKMNHGLRPARLGHRLRVEGDRRLVARRNRLDPVAIGRRLPLRHLRRVRGDRTPWSKRRTPVLRRKPGIPLGPLGVTDRSRTCLFQVPTKLLPHVRRDHGLLKKSAEFGTSLRRVPPQPGTVGEGGAPLPPPPRPPGHGDSPQGEGDGTRKGGGNHRKKASFDVSSAITGFIPSLIPRPCLGTPRSRVIHPRPRSGPDTAPTHRSRPTGSPPTPRASRRRPRGSGRRTPRARPGDGTIAGFPSIAGSSTQSAAPSRS